MNEASNTVKLTGKKKIKTEIKEEPMDAEMSIVKLDSEAETGKNYMLIICMCICGWQEICVYTCFNPTYVRKIQLFKYNHDNALKNFRVVSNRVFVCIMSCMNVLHYICSSYYVL